MAKIDWTQLRITRATRARLQAYQESLQREADLGRFTGKCLHNVAITVDDTLNALLDKVDAHRQRAKKANGRAKRAVAPTDDTLPVGQR